MKKSETRQLPELRTFFGMNKEKGAWVVERIIMRGDMVLQRETFEPDFRVLAYERLQKMIRKFLGN